MRLSRALQGRISDFWVRACFNRELTLMDPSAPLRTGANLRVNSRAFAVGPFLAASSAFSAVNLLLGLDQGFVFYSFASIPLPLTCRTQRGQARLVGAGGDYRRRAKEWRQRNKKRSRKSSQKWKVSSYSGTEDT